MGTVAYMSPEQTQGIKVDHRTDIWALGAVIYEMTTGQQPFVGDYEQAVMYSIMNEEPKPVTGLRSGVPMELERNILKTLEKNPDERYQQLNDLVVDLKALEKREISASGSARPRAKSGVSKKTLLAAALILVVISALFLQWLFLSDEEVQVIDSIAVLPLVNLTGDPIGESDLQIVFEQDVRTIGRQ